MILREQGNRTCVYFAVDFAPVLGVRFSNALDEAFRKLNPPAFTAKASQSCLFRWPDERRIMIMTPQRLAWQTLGLPCWLDHVEEHVATCKDALATMETTECKRAGFKVEAYLPLGMSFAEMGQLMFGSFAAPLEALEAQCGRLSDPLVRVAGSVDDIGYVLVVTAMNEEHIKTTLLAHPNLELFLENKLLDTGIKDFYETIGRTDCLYVDVDLSRNDVSTETIGDFLSSAFSRSEQITEACVRHLRSQPLQE